ncbi:hypothetical protein PC121_g8393 [Phytophthora cactorum]|nr:hypothetical protein PC121_g8393 [Phytophthora cactorum]
MKISTLIGVVAVFLAAAEAKETKETKDSTPAQTPLATMPEAQLDPTIQDTIQEAATPSPEKDAASKEPTIAYDKVILAVTTSNSTGGYSSQIPPDASMLSGKSVKISYNNNALESTTKEGGTQNLVLWHQLTPEAQEALNDDQSFGGVQVPVNDDYFLLNLGKAWPFE